MQDRSYFATWLALSQCKAGYARYSGSYDTWSSEVFLSKNTQLTFESSLLPHTKKKYCFYYCSWVPLLLRWPRALRTETLQIHKTKRKCTWPLRDFYLHKMTANTLRSFAYVRLCSSRQLLAACLFWGGNWLTSVDVIVCHELQQRNILATFQRNTWRIVTTHYISNNLFLSNTFAIIFNWLNI